MPHPKLVPELQVSGIARSRDFYVGLLGFEVVYERPEERFLYLDRNGAELMLEQATGRAFVAGVLEYPYGRGMNLQIEVSGVDELYARVRRAGVAIYLVLEEKWYRKDNFELGNRQFVVQDPDVYLLRFFEDLGGRPASR